MMDDIFNSPTAAYTDANANTDLITFESIMKAIAEAQQALDKIPKPEHDCLVMTLAVWERLVAESAPTLSHDSDRFMGLLFYVEHDGMYARARAIQLRAQGKRPLVYV